MPARISIQLTDLEFVAFASVAYGHRMTTREYMHKLVREAIARQQDNAAEVAAIDPGKMAARGA